MDLEEEEKKSSEVPKILEEENSKVLKSKELDEIPDLTAKEASKKRVRGKSAT